MPADDETVNVPDLPDLPDQFVLPEYRVECYEDSGTELRYTYSTYGSWTVEGDFLIVWDALGIRQAHRIPKDVAYMKTIEVAPKPKHANDAESIDDSDLRAPDDEINPQPTLAASAWMPEVEDVPAQHD